MAVMACRDVRSKWPSEFQHHKTQRQTDGFVATGRRHWGHVFHTSLHVMIKKYHMEAKNQQHCTSTSSHGPLCIKFIFLTKIYYRGVLWCATNFPGDVWCHGLTIYLL